VNVVISARVAAALQGGRFLGEMNLSQAFVGADPRPNGRVNLFYLIRHSPDTC
jgi:hypothetical protein